MISLRPNSYAKVVPISAALASVSRTPSGYGSSLLRAPISYPLSFRTTTPIPQCPSSLKQLHQHWPCTIQEEVVSISWGRGVEESGGAHRSFGTHLRRLVMLQKSAEQFCRLPHVEQPLQKKGFRLCLKNAAIDPKNAAIGYSCVYKHGLNTAAIGL